jgi:hypothetical protein
MKRIIIIVSLAFFALTAYCQKDKTFTTIVTFEKGIRFGDGTTQTTAGGAGTVTWDAIVGKPNTFPPASHSHNFNQITGKPTTLSGYGITDAANINHNHNSLYKPISYVPSWGEITAKPSFAPVAVSGSYDDLVDKPAVLELSEAIPALSGVKLPVMTQAQINNLTPSKGMIIFNDTDNVLQIYNGTVWKTIITGN